MCLTLFKPSPSSFPSPIVNLSFSLCQTIEKANTGLCTIYFELGQIQQAFIMANYRVAVGLLVGQGNKK